MIIQFFNPELAHYLLALSCCFAGAQFIIPLYCYYRKQISLMVLACPFALAQWIALSICCCCLIISAINDDFSVLTILQNSSSDKPVFYKIVGLWTTHEGSIFLWIYILANFNLALTFIKQSISQILKFLALSILGGCCAGFNFFCFLTANPFLRAWPVPLEGEGMNPLLQDPSLALHPPLLYTGYIGLSVPFALSIASLIHNQIDINWAKLIKPWVNISWLFLTSGIALGSWWSYYILGWGGYWFWDPVENTSLITWLLATALLHSLNVSQRFETLKRWNLYLVVVTFLCSIGGTFLVRSGILISVHAFSSDPYKGIFLLFLLGIIAGASGILLIWKAPLLLETVQFSPLSKEGIILLHNILLCSMTFVILTATLYPPLLQIFTGQTLSIGPDFYKKTLTPFVWIALFFMALGPFTSSKNIILSKIIDRLIFPLLISFIIFFILWLWFYPPIISLFLTLCIWAIMLLGLTYIKKTKGSYLNLRQIYQQWGQFPWSFHGANLAHFGLIITFIGIIGMTFSRQKLVEIHKGDHVHFAGFDWNLANVSLNQTRNNFTEQAMIQVSSGNQTITWLYPCKILFFRQRQIISYTSIHTNLIYNLYAILGETRSIHHLKGKKLYILKLYFHPFAPWIWLGTVFMLAGSMISLLNSFNINLKSRKQNKKSNL